MQRVEIPEKLHTMQAPAQAQATRSSSIKAAWAPPERGGSNAHRGGEAS
jgi:hypothetical protein